MIGAFLAAVTLLLSGALEPKGARVIVQLTPQTTLHGTVTDQTQEGLHITTTTGDEVIIDLSTVHGVVQLVDIEKPLPAEVKLKTGRVIRGDLLADNWTSIQMLVQGVTMTINRDDIVTMQLKPDIASIFAAQRALIEDDDEVGRVELARWLMANKSWALAARELHMITDRFNSFEAKRLLQHAEAFAKLDTDTAKDAPDRGVSDQDIAQEQDTSAQPPTGQHPTPTTVPERLPLPSNDIVHLLRVLELDPTNPPTITVSEATRRKLHLGWGGNRLLPATDEGLRHLLAMHDQDVLQLLFDLRARGLYGEVEVLQPPESLRRFATDVHDAWLVTRCGTRSCHGGKDSGRFRLLRRGRVDDRLRAGNLLLLERASFHDGPVLNWITPANSLLIQYALPRSKASTPHPRVPGWRPAMDDTRMMATLKWIRSMRQPRPTIDWPPSETDPPAESTAPKQPVPAPSSDDSP